MVDLAKIREVGLPFWIAGGAGSPEALAAARREGATGIQVGTLFAYCDESGVAADLKHSVLTGAARDDVRVRTDPRASPTGFPFKIVEWDDDPAADTQRTRICDLGYLRVAYRTESGATGFRCSAEPVHTFVAKGGREDDAHGRRCLCNALMANVGLPQVRGQEVEPPLLTSGDDLMAIAGFLRGRTRYSAGDVVDYLVAGDAAD